MLNGTSHSHVNGASKQPPPSLEEEVLGMSPEEAIEERQFYASRKAIRLNHNLTEFKANGPGLFVANCTKCLCKVIVDMSREKSFGVGIFYACDPHAIDKQVDIPPAVMSDAHRELINRPWCTPGEKLKSKK